MLLEAGHGQNLKVGQHGPKDAWGSVTGGHNGTVTVLQTLPYFSTENCHGTGDGGNAALKATG